jgi:hypothetical protein
MRLLFRSFAVIAIVFVVTAVPVAAHAASASFYGPIVPTQCNCPGAAPSFGCVLATIQNVINFSITLGVVAATLAFVYAGFTWMTSGGNPEARSRGRSMLLNVFIGLFILLTAWLVVDFIMKQLYNESNYGPWNSILVAGSEDQCIVPSKPAAIGGILGHAITGELGGTGGQLGTGGGATGGTSGATGTGTSHMNISSATSYADSHAAGGPTGNCALYVRQALSAGGLTSFDANHPANAYQYGPYLQQAGFTQISSSGYTPQTGDVIVFQPVTGHSSGHIEIYDGSQWVSDFKQSSMYPSQDYVTQHGSYTIYRG